MKIESQFDIGDTVFYNDNYGKNRKSRLDISHNVVSGFVYRDGVLYLGFGDMGHDSDFEETFEESLCFPSSTECTDDFNKKAIWNFDNL